jgi:class 3 adenylate cyclase
MSRPASPPALAAQCHICGTLLSGALARVFRVAGIKRSPRNPNICSRCDTHVEEGRLVEMTVVFADLSSFTELTHELGAQRTHEVVDGFLRAASGIITRHGGFIDKYIGDAVMALFNVPIHHDDHERRAAVVLGTAVLTLFMVGFEIIAHIILHSLDSDFSLP